MDKSKITPELLAKILREHSDMLSLLNYAPMDGSGDEYKSWLEKRDSLVSKIKKID